MKGDSGETDGAAADAAAEAAVIDRLVEAFEHHQAGRFTEAQAGYAAVLAMNPDQADALHLSGVLCYQQGNLLAASEKIGRALELAPEASSYWSNYGNVLRAQKHMDEAINAYQSALTFDPGSADAMNNLANSYIVAGRLGEALTTLQTLCEQHPEHPEGHNNLGLALKTVGREAEAVHMFERAVQISPNYSDALNNLGNLYASLQRIDPAIDAFARAVDINGMDAAVRRSYGAVLMSTGRLEEATEQFAIAKALDPRNPQSALALGNAYQERGRLEDAEEEYELTLQLESEHPAALNNLGTLWRVRGDFDTALSYIDRALAQDPQYVDALFNSATIHIERGRIVEAEQLLLMVRTLAPDFLPALENLVDLYERLGDNPAVLRTLNEWRQVAPDDPIAEHLLLAAMADTPERCSPEYVRAEFDRAAKFFDGRLENLEYRVPDLLNRALLAELDVEKEASLRVLDAGCGTGLCAQYLRPWARSLVGVDLSPNMLDQATQLGVYDGLVCADLVEFLAEHPASYDLIAAGDVLVYFGDLAEVLVNARRSLAPGGRLMFSVERATDTQTYTLSNSGRYRHCDTYLSDCLDSAGFTSTLAPQTLRLEKRLPVHGYFVTAVATS